MWRLSIGAALVAVLAIAVVVAAPLYEIRRVRIAIESIRARGEPVTAEEVLAEFPERSSRLVENVGRFQTVYNRAFGDSFTPSEIDAYLGGPESLHADAETLAVLRESLARAALTAYREGGDAGARAASAATDPFSGKLLRSRIDPDGMLVLWSVGENLVDDGGSAGDGSEDPPKDLVWRIPKR